MRFVVTIYALVCLGGCDAQPPADPVPSQVPEVSALEDAAKTSCAELTNYRPDRLASMTPEMRALVVREYNLCVAKVSGEER
jgi:hypothetical protein